MIKTENISNKNGFQANGIFGGRSKYGACLLKVGITNEPKTKQNRNTVQSQQERIQRKNYYFIREISECPAVLVTMLISVRGLGSVKKINK